MMDDRESVQRLCSTVETLRKLAQELYENSDEFPAVNRNAKRILAAVEVLKLNTEHWSEE